MPTGNTTLYDVVTRQLCDPLVGLVEDVTLYAPEFSEIPVITRPGTTYRIGKRTALPPSQFRVANAGVKPGKSAWRQEVKEMFFIDSPIVMDEMVRKADDGSLGDLLAQEAQGVLQATVILIGSQMYYGNLDSGDANGFQGVRRQLAFAVGAGGTTNTTSAYALWLNNHGVHFDIGKDGEIALPPFQRYPIPDSNNTGAYYWAWASNLSCFIGFTVASNYSCWAVTGIDGAGTNNLTDAVAAKLVENIPLTRRNGLKWFMNRRAHRVLQASRTSVSTQVAGAASGTPAWSPPPQAMEGYPIVVTDSIVNTENNT